MRISPGSGAEGHHGREIGSHSQHGAGPGRDEADYGREAAGDEPAEVLAGMAKSAHEARRGAGEYEDQTLVRYTEGHAVTRNGNDGRSHLIVRARIYKQSHGGSDWNWEDGKFEAVYQLKFFTHFDVLDYPAAPEHFDAPPPIEERDWHPFLNPTKARWTFGDGSTLVATGPALSRIAEPHHSLIRWWYGVTAFITGGKGRFDGSIGQAVTMGYSQFEPPPSSAEGKEFQFDALHILRVMRTKSHGQRPGRAPAQEYE